MMPGTITVKGIGRVLAKPDYVVITMDLASRKMEYNEAMDEEAEKINALTETLVIIGFEKDDLKTTNFNVSTAYRNVKDSRTEYEDEYIGKPMLKAQAIDFTPDV